MIFFSFFYNPIATVIKRILEQCQVDRKGAGPGLLLELYVEASKLHLKRFLTLMWFILHGQSMTHV